MNEPPKSPQPPASGAPRDSVAGKSGSSAAAKPEVEQARPGNTEVTVDLGRRPSKPTGKVAGLLPPGAANAEEARASKQSLPAPPPSSPGQPPGEASSPAAATVHAAAKTPVRRLSAEERAARRFWKNVIMFAFFVVVLLVVFYLFSR